MNYTICNKCFSINTLRATGSRCVYCHEGEVLGIDTYVDFTSPMQPPLTLHRHPDSMTIFTEKGFFEHFNMNASRVISEEYLQDMPQFLRVYPIDPIGKKDTVIIKNLISEARLKIIE